MEKNIQQNKRRVCMLSAADSVKGQGVGSAYLEVMRLLSTYGKDDFELTVNRGVRNADVVHAHTIDLGSFFKLRSAKCPTVMSVHFTPEMIENSVRLPRLFMRIFIWYILKVYRSADIIHIVNPDLSEALGEYGFKKERIHYIPNFVAKSQFYPKTPEQRREIRARWGYEDGDFVCFASGQTRAGKGVKEFVEVARMLPEVKFIWAGGFPFGSMADGYHEIKPLVDNPPANVRFPGIVPRDEINDLLNACDLFFFPSYQELFPMSILEAASTHTPLLLRGLPEYRNILEGYYCKADDNDAFARAICRIRDDKAFYDELAKKSAEVSAQYSEERTYALWKEFYGDLASGQYRHMEVK